ncbi:MAG: tRNA (adenosine(37)-N6)-dimethylallyltransferase MiaA [Clostridiales bacterium]|uniref:tRNA (adenosine(37)-N6)-dimethylallyltransferase MiaA n=1 Tax=Dysosmobacter welbionis TaxID=2093857 RepID=UPI000D7ACB78|nr:MAG: tRNA (adenosine(37)-N6)-dimethylallyltransferase MiaA [Clostridiales bacterium]
MNRTVVCVVGPTASGKTKLGVALAHLLDGEVVSADSMQIYRRMDIGTAKPTAEEREGIPHHMIDVAEPEENWSAARYVTAATECVEDIFRRGKRPVIVGGTGLYVDSLISGRSFAVQCTGWRQRLQARVAAEGIEPLREELRQVDPAAYDRIAAADEKRIIRALEVWHETGKTITQHNLETQQRPPRYRAVTIGLNFAEKAALWERINRRVDEMMAQGLAEEVRQLLASGVPRTCTAMQAIGYKELAAAVAGRGDLAAAAEEVKLRTRQYSKRQLTWFRRSRETQWYFWAGKPDFAAARHFATEKMEEYGVL